MIPVKFIGSQGGTISNAIKAISYLIQLKTDQQLNLVAINASWGTSAYSHSLFQAVGLAEKADVLFVAAAGNNATSLELSPYYPASYPNANIISVGASTATGTLASFSSYGVTSVDLVAPGVGIYTTVPSKVLASAYAAYNGTSLAAAHVTGAAALYASIQKKMPTAKLVKAALLDSIVIQTNLKAKVGRAGRLNTANF
jgi:subtilisin family serine protease